MIKDLITVSELVEDILAHNKGARNSDKELIRLVLEHYGLYLNEEQRELWNKCVSFESITRARRTVQNKGGKYQALPEVQQSRRTEEKIMRKGGYTVNQLYKTPEQLGLPVDK